MRTAINACCHNGDAKRNDKSLDVYQLLADARDLGYDGVEVADPIGQFGDKDTYQKAMADHGLEASAFFASCMYNPWEPNIKDYQQKLDNAQDLGMDMMCVCGGFMGNSRRNLVTADYDMFASSLGPMVEYAKSRGVTIAYHPHRGAIIETLAETQEIMKRVPDVRICIDIAHLEAVGQDVIEFIEAIGDKIVYTHIKDYSWEKDSFMPLGAGDGKLDVAQAIDALAKVGYDGWLSVELDRKWEEGDPTAKEFKQQCMNYLQANCAHHLSTKVATA